jgi:hypothetical protein
MPQPQQRKPTPRARGANFPTQDECVGTYLSTTSKLFYPTIIGGPSGNWRRSNKPGTFTVTGDMAGIITLTQERGPGNRRPGLSVKVTLESGSVCEWTDNQSYEVNVAVTSLNYIMMLVVDIKQRRYRLR